MAVNYFEQFVAPGIERDMSSRQLGMQDNQMRYQREQDERQRMDNESFSKDFGVAWEAGDTGSLASLIGKHPQQAEKILGAIGIKDQQQRAMTGNFAQQLSAAISSGNTQGALGLVQKNADFLSSIGQDPAELANEIQTNPQGVMRASEQMMLLTMTPDKLMQYRQKLEDQQLKRDQMAVQMRGQDITARGQDIGASNATLDRQIRMLEAEQKALDRQASRETNDLKRREIEQKLTENKRAIEQGKVERNDALRTSYNSTDEALSIVKDLKGSKGMSSAVGWQSAAPTIPGSASADFETKFEQLQGMLTMENMGIMKGVLSDSDIKMIKSASAGLSLGMSEKEFTNRLSAIEKKLESKLSATKSKNPDLFGNQVDKPQAMSDEDLINKYLR